MPKRGELKPGSLAARIAGIVAEGCGAPVARAQIAARIAPGERRWLSRTLAALELSGMIVAAAEGYRFAQARPAEPPLFERAAPPLAEQSIALLAAIIRRAHALRARGLVAGAAGLLRAAAERLGRHPAAQDLAALADLFEHCPGLYPQLDLQARAAA